MSQLERKGPLKEKDKDKDKGFEDWLSQVYDVKAMTEEEISDTYESVKYKGFDRELMLKKLYEKVQDKKTVIQLILACSLAGPNRAAKMKMRNGKTPEEMGIPASRQQKTENLSCNRISASTADLAAYYFKKLNVPKKLIDEECPAWLQFPTAGSIKMPQRYREQHIAFMKRFSTQIKGAFNDSIYSQMMNNAYLDDKLHLFD